MKHPLKLVALIPFCVLYFISCQKKPVVIPPKEDPQCKIINFNSTNTGEFNISYNALGNPVNAISTGRPSTGNPYAQFVYDKYNRISDFIGYYTLTLDSNQQPLHVTYEYWVRYAYADNNPSSLPIGDTSRFIGQYHNGVFAQPAFPGEQPIGPLKTLYNNYTFDAQGRLVQTVTREGILTSPPVNYQYDADGNLIRPNITYDSKKNYRGRNKVLMLVDMNYSVNNPILATTYNTQGYPTIFPALPSSAPYLDNFLRRGVNFKTMDYDCSSGQKIN